MKFELSKDAVLACDLPEHRLRCGDLVKLVEHHVAPDRTEPRLSDVFVQRYLFNPGIKSK